VSDGKRIVDDNHKLCEERIKAISVQVAQPLVDANCCVHECMEISMRLAAATALEYAESDRVGAAEVLQRYCDQFKALLMKPLASPPADGGRSVH
jgi:hypothetical protein